MKLSIVWDQGRKHKASNEGEMWYIWNIDGDQEAYQLGKVYSTKNLTSESEMNESEERDKKSQHSYKEPNKGMGK
jgi:hypothetical protein